MSWKYDDDVIDNTRKIEELKDCLKGIEEKLQRIEEHLRAIDEMVSPNVKQPKEFKPTLGIRHDDFRTR